MGGSNTKLENVEPTAGKKILVIGGSWGGRIISTMLLQFDQHVQITIVDKSPHFEWIPNNFMTLT